MHKLPDDPFNPLKLADWLEIYAMLAPDGNSSRGDLERSLYREALYKLDDDEAIERKTLETFEELEQRVEATSEAYPFKLDHQGILYLKSSWEDFPAYTFCLCLSYLDLSEIHKATKLFEQMSCLAAKGYLHGNVIGFGWPRVELPASFPDAITKLCNLIGEGDGFRQQGVFDRKDDTVDLVAWKDFTDKRPSKILMFGQCATGQNWEKKIGDLDAEPFCKQWMQITPFYPPLTSFFIPHRIERNKWELIARKAGILFDRCRIAFWAHQEKADYDSYIEWTRELLVKTAL